VGIGADRELSALVWRATVLRMESLIAQVLGLYLSVALVPAVVAWRRGLPRPAVLHALVAGVLFGWTLIGYVWAWIVALDDPPRAEHHRIEQRIIVRCSAGRAAEAGALGQDRSSARL
jgi:hypothetical protein